MELSPNFTYMLWSAMAEDNIDHKAKLSVILVVSGRVRAANVWSKLYKRQGPSPAKWKLDWGSKV
jgi:hypothetical protein